MAIFPVLIVAGPLSVINHATHRTSGKPFAIKTIDLQKYEQSTGLSRAAIEEEMELCATLKHPFIYVRPHNLVLASKDNSAPVKLTGFGVAINGNNEQIYEAIQNGRYSVSGGIWNFISNSAKDLLIRLLNRDEEQRFSATEALQHDWLRDKEAYAPRRHLQETVDHIKRYNARRKLKSTILAAVNTDKWSKFPGTNGGLSASSSTFFSGDLPGGDSCHPDGCTKASQPAAADLRGAHQILESLDRIAVLTDSPVLPQLVQGQLMEDGSFRKLLQ
ncbi:unnamed protein product, partial [Mesorhabditis spiculigera]